MLLEFAENTIIAKIEEILKSSLDLIKYNIEKSIDSSDGNVYIVFSKASNYVVKIYDNPLHANRLVRLHTFLVSKGLSVPTIIYSNCSNVIPLHT